MGNKGEGWVTKLCSVVCKLSHAQYLKQTQNEVNYHLKLLPFSTDLMDISTTSCYLKIRANAEVGAIFNWLNPRALNMAKTPWRFGCSECNRANEFPLFMLSENNSQYYNGCSKMLKIYTDMVTSTIQNQKHFYFTEISTIFPLPQTENSSTN